MNDNNRVSKQQEEFVSKMMKTFDIWAIFFMLFFFFFFLYAFNFLPSFSTKGDNTASMELLVEENEDPNRIENGIHVRSGLIVGDGYELVLRHCGGCHSHKLVTQNSADAKGWTETIRWMQETQKLWDLGGNEAPIVAYLAKYYGLKQKNRRAPLKNIDWYEL
ncbi:MAG: hypothetical protein MK207_04275 [Saprospiraceae bacterium]|nr:hypothetical protein [Saprospiraceae bacterium]